MPNPRDLQVGDRVRFVELPAEWDDPGYRVPHESIELLRALIERGAPARVSRIADDGYPWVDLRMRDSGGTLRHESWGLYEQTGWVRVEERARSLRPRD